MPEQKEKETVCERKPNCRFYLEKIADTSRIGHNGSEIYCVAAACRNYRAQGTVLQFDDNGHFMRQCSTQAEIEGGLPLKLDGQQIPLDSIEGVGSGEVLRGKTMVYEKVSETPFVTAS